MDKYWRLWLLVLVAFLFGTTTVVAAPAFKGGTRNPAPTLFTLLDGVDVASGAQAHSATLMWKASGTLRSSFGELDQMASEGSLQTYVLP